jgi:hypothetical protein
MHWSFLNHSWVFSTPNATILRMELKENIRGVIREIEPHLCENVIENFDKRMAACKKSRGGHLADIVFHM